ncbi:MAG TPA: DUF1566 domain-containing protein [Nitrospira sp.]|nr:DUF1566 domain-containing protein [Nitrospira sp.]
MHASHKPSLSRRQSCLIAGLSLAGLSLCVQAYALSQSDNEGRFTVLTEFNREAVRDNKTGLIWERSPGVGMYEWETAQHRCLANHAGGETDWRVPTVQELNSLVDASAMEIKLPEGHPFSNVEPAIYWSATGHQQHTGYAMFVNFSSGGTATLEKSMSSFVWCVRGRMNAR